MSKFFKNILTWKLVAILVSALVLGYISLPDKYRLAFLNPQAVKDMEVVLGLDLQGGTQLDYRIDLRGVPESKHKEIVDGVTEVITRRVNNLGVSEPNIYQSTVGDETHIIVELAGVANIQEAKEKVGKTIQLEFKEQKTGNTEAEVNTIKVSAETFLKNAQANPGNFSILAEEESKAFPNLVTYLSKDFAFKDEIGGSKLADKIFAAEPGTIINEVIEDNSGYIFANNQLQEQNGYFIIQVLEKRDQEKEINEPKEVSTQHILISYDGADRAEGVSRSRSEAETLANEVLAKAQAAGANFDDLAKEYSNEPGAATSLGKLPQPVVEGDQTYVSEFSEAALALTQANQVADKVVKTQFGYHIIKALEVKAAKNEKTTEQQVKYNQVFYSNQPDPWQATELNGEHFVSATVEFDQFLQPQVSIQFDSEGAQIFANLTEKNLNKPLAIFVGGELISSPNVQSKITGGQAVITGSFSLEEAQNLARELNTGAIPAPITLVGQYNIGSTLGQAALNKSLVASLIGFIALGVFLIGYYRLPGLLATFALGIYAIILVFVIKASLPVSLAVIIGLIIGIAALYNILTNKESTAEKVVSMIIATFALFFFTFLLREPIILTLAGIAGVVLSVGMAVDANILIFERIKEEIRSGRDLTSAIEAGFNRAWSSIRDSNFSSLLTCAILFYFGSSIIRGFALNLAAGILISMFTAITISKTFLRAYAKFKFQAQKTEVASLMGAKTGQKERKPFNIIGKSKIWLGVSGILILISIGSLLVRGLNPGLDFRGGTLMEIKIANESITKETLNDKFTDIAQELDKIAAAKKPPKQTTDDPSVVAEPGAAVNVKIDPKGTDTETVKPVAENEEIHIGTPSIVESISETGEKSFIIRFGFIDNATHDEIISKLTTELGQIEEVRFNTIGPVISSTLKNRAIFALLIAMVMIVLYIAFAFRNVPKSINAWKFGICAIAALLHDVILILGVFSVFQIEIDSLFITALLTIIGFSVHDTIVVFDRIRENLKEYRADADNFDQVSNAALTQTMARSINTSVSTLFTLLALVIFGAQSIFFFSLALTLGIIFGTYSSIFVASPLLAAWKKLSK